MRLIDVDAFTNRHCEGCKDDIRESCKDDPICATMMWITEEPTVDAVPVVRCKDCVYYQYGIHFTDVKFCCRLKDDNNQTVRYPFSDMDFCSRGERKE